MKKNADLQSYLAEAIGSFFLVLVYGLTGDPFAIGLTLMALIYVGYEVSGAHYNPAVSLAFFLKRELSGVDLFGFIFFQLLGGFLAAAVIFFLASTAFYIAPPASTNLYQQSLAEVLFTFLFVLIILVFTLTTSSRRNHLYGLVAGLTFAGMLMVSMPISGGVLNPAIFIGFAGFDALTGGGTLSSLWLYTFAPLAGGALAAFVFTYLRPTWEG